MPAPTARPAAPARPARRRARAGLALTGLLAASTLAACGLGGGDGGATPGTPVASTGSAGSATTTAPAGAPSGAAASVSSAVASAASGAAAALPSGLSPVDLARLKITDGGSRAVVRTPAGDVACVLTSETGDEVTCQSFVPGWHVNEPAPANCPASEWGKGLVLGADGPAIGCLGRDVAVANARPLEPGQAVRVGADVCANANGQVVCANVRTGRGIALGSAGYRLL